MINPPSINLARRPFRNNTTFYAVFAICFVMLLAATAYNARDFFARGSELSVLRQRLADRSHRYNQIFQDVEAMKKEIARVNLSVLSEKSSFANGLIVARLFSWSVLFERLEEVIPYDVKIRAIRPAISAQAIEIQIDGMAKTAADLYEFEARLADSDFFTNVYPLSENTRESRNEINFDLALSYIPAGKSGLDPSPPTPTAALPQSPEGEEEQDQEGGTLIPPRGGQEAKGNESPPDRSGEGVAEGQDLDPTPSPGLPAAMPTAATPMATGVTTQGPGPGAGPPPQQPQAGQPGTATPPAAAPGGAQRPTSPGKPPVLMTNREFLEFVGEDQFMRHRGALAPIQPDAHGPATNAGLIRSIGLEAFLAARGDLTIQQQRKP